MTPRSWARVVLALCLALFVEGGIFVTSVDAAETITYTYDAFGRLVQVARSGTVNNGISESYSYDRADNRSNVMVTNGATLTVSPASLPAGTVGAAYSQTITASGGTGTGYSYSLSSGALPAGLSLSSSGSLSGTPSAAGTPSFTITAIDSASTTGSHAYIVTINPAVGISPASLPNGTVGTAYSQTISASGGSAGYSFAVSAGALPAGLSLNSSSGAITGTPITAAGNSFTITATDNTGNSASQAYSVTINGAAGQCSGISFAIGNASGTEGDTLIFTVTKSGSTSSICSVNYATANGTAVAGTHYTATSGTLTFLAAQTTATISVVTNNLNRLSGTKTMYVNLSSPTDGASITTSQGIGSIAASGGGTCKTC